MKLLELRLTAFGPFTNLTLDLSGGDKGLHVIFGPNEAGKSSALRALDALLYGIPGRTEDAFLHPYGELRIGARMSRSSGDQIEIFRRKALKNSLYGPGDAREDDRALDPFLGGVGQDQFRMFWGIDHARLVEGGREILNGRGDLGESLFAAGAGASHLGALRRKLDEEAAKLFAPRARNRIVNEAIGRLSELRREQREATVSAGAWTAQYRAAQEAEKAVASMSGQVKTLADARTRLERMKRVLPLLAEREATRDHLAQLVDAAILAGDFSRRRQTAEAELFAAQQQYEQATASLGEQETRVTAFGPTPLLVPEAEAVNDLYKRLGGHRQALTQRPQRMRQLESHRARALQLLAELRPGLNIDGAQTLLVFLGRRARIEKLALKRAAIDERVGAAREKLKSALERTQQLAHEASALPPARDPEGLILAIEEARRRGDAEAALSKVTRSLGRIEAQRDAIIKKLGLVAPAAAQLHALQLPSVATVTTYRDKAQLYRDGVREASSEHLRIRKRTLVLEAAIATLRTKKAVPMEEDLAAARERREAAFRLLREQWEDERDVSEEALSAYGTGNLADLYAGLVAAADEIADRLRGEAVRVAELTQHMEERTRLGAELEELVEAEGRREAATKAMEASWLELWKSVVLEAPPIHDALTWLEEYGRLLQQDQELLESRQNHEGLEEWVTTQLKTLRDAMARLEPAGEPAPSLSQAIIAGDRMRQRIEGEQLVRSEHARKTRETRMEIAESETTLGEAENASSVWKDEWELATSGLGKEGTVPPDDALNALAQIEEVQKNLADAEGFQARIAGIDRDAEEFRANAKTLAARLGEGRALEGAAEDVWVDELHRRLAAALKEEEARLHAASQLARVREDIARNTEAIAAAQLALAGLCREARCETSEGLASAEERSAAALRFRGEMDRLEKELLRMGEGSSIGQLELEAKTVDRDAIDGQLFAIGAELDELDEKLSEARNARASALAELRGFDGPSTAGAKAEDIQNTLAQLRDGVVQYSRLRLASTLLARRIEEYRRKNQAPLLQRASTRFKELTLGKFERLEADVEDKTPILIGVRSDGKRVPAHGMSEGTRDQLFFALRLASVEASCASGEPLPFVVDDVLVQFDDDRSEAALKVLSSLAASTQVILFTHHRQVRDAAEALADGGVFVHELVTPE